MIQSNKELYQEINNIIKVLKSSGNDEIAKKIENALSISTVSGEILGETCLTLENLNSKILAEQLGIKNIVEYALNYLHRIL